MLQNFVFTEKREGGWKANFLRTKYHKWFSNFLCTKWNQIWIKFCNTFAIHFVFISSNACDFVNANVHVYKNVIYFLYLKLQAYCVRRSELKTTFTHLFFRNKLFYIYFSILKNKSQTGWLKNSWPYSL